MVRAERRQAIRVGVKVQKRRVRGERSDRDLALLAGVSVDRAQGNDDASFVIEMKNENAHAAVAWANEAIYLVAKRKLTGERIGCMSVTIMPPHGKALIQDFLVVPGRWGTIAAYAMIERLRSLKAAKIGFVASDNEAMLCLLSRLGMRITGFMMEAD